MSEPSSTRSPGCPSCTRRHFTGAVFLIGSLAVTGCGQPSTVSGGATIADVQEAIAAASKLTDEISITQQDLPIIDRDPSMESVSFLIEQKRVAEYKFKVTDYTLDEAGARSKIALDEMAKAIDKSYKARKKFAESARLITASASVGTQVGVVGGEIGLSGPLDVILELLGAIKPVVELDTARVEIGIKGYADGEQSKDWVERQRPLRPSYRTFKILEPAEGHNDNWIFYRRGEVDRPPIVGRYSNDDLPDLRAQYVRTEFVEPFVERCRNASRCQVFVLKNKAIEEPEKPEWRKVEVHLSVYVKKREGE